MGMDHLIAAWAGAWVCYVLYLVLPYVVDPIADYAAKAGWTRELREVFRSPTYLDPMSMQMPDDVLVETTEELMDELPIWEDE